MDDLTSKIFEIANNSIKTKQELVEDKVLLGVVSDVVQSAIEVFRGDGKILFCGNGGSAADAQHLAAEFTGRFYSDRDPLFAEALHVNTSYLTAVANDYSFDEVFSRLVKAKGRKGDMLIGLSTSGNSQNVVNALEVANDLGMITVSLTGQNDSKMGAISKFLMKVPSTDTPRIQECHILIGHIICQLVEESLF